eukprot:gene10065-7035_t
MLLRHANSRRNSDQYFSLDMFLSPRKPRSLTKFRVDHGQCGAMPSLFFLSRAKLWALVVLLLWVGLYCPSVTQGVSVSRPPSPRIIPFIRQEQVKVVEFPQGAQQPKEVPIICKWTMFGDGT